MSSTTHKFSIHPLKVINHSLIPIGQLTEEAHEARNKEFKNFSNLIIEAKRLLIFDSNLDHDEVDVSDIDSDSYNNQTINQCDNIIGKK